MIGIGTIADEHRRLREFFEKTILIDCWGIDPPDPGGLQDAAESLGLLVRVPADEAFKEEWGEENDTMFVWAWNPLAQKHLGKRA